MRDSTLVQCRTCEGKGCPQCNGSGGFPDRRKVAMSTLIDKTELRPTEEAYLSLLRLPHTDAWRVLNQDILARLRDEIAAEWQWDAERVQEYFENSAKAKVEIPAVDDADLVDLMLKGARLSIDKTGNRQNMHAALKAIRPYLREPKRESNWQSITTPPKQNERVLAYDEFRNAYVVARFTGVGWVLAWNDEPLYDLVQWQPINGIEDGSANE